MTSDTDDQTQPSGDFVFGTLATDGLRIARLRAARSGVGHGQQIAPLDPLPGEAVTICATTGPQLPASHVTCYYTTDGSDPAGQHGVAQRGQAVPLQQRGVQWDTLQWGYVTQWEGQIPGQPAGTLVRYRIEAWSAEGGSHLAREIAAVFSGEPPADVPAADLALFTLPGEPPAWPARRSGGDAYHVDAYAAPEWLRDAVIYQIFVDRFAPDPQGTFAEPDTLGGFFGGTLRGVTGRIGALAELGVTCLWLTPIFASPSHHGYDTTDYRQVEPRLGTLEDLRELIGAAHARGMRVILDFVANHCSHEHPAFRAAQADRAAPEASWFTFTGWPERYLSFFGVPTMPQLDTERPEVVAHLCDSARYWLGQGVDGFRLDYANGPSHAFWSQFRAATRAAAPESAIFGEVVETPELQRSYAGRMDGCLDFVLLQALRQLFVFGTLGPSAFDAFLRQHLAFFPPGFVLPSFLDNHDMNRFLWVARGDARRLKLAALCQFTLPHPPIVYYGTEVGLSQRHDVRAPGADGGLEQSRLPMLWGEAQDGALRLFYQRLIRLRRAHQALWRGERRTLLADDARGIYGYACADGGRRAVIVLNTSGQPQDVELPQARGCALALATDDGVAWDAPALRLPPWAGAALSAAPEPTAQR